MRELCQYEDTGLKEHCSPENRKICLQPMWHRRMSYLATNKCNMAFIGGTANSECVQWTYCPISAAQTEETKPDLGICQYKFQFGFCAFFLFSKLCYPACVLCLKHVDTLCLDAAGTPDQFLDAQLESTWKENHRAGDEVGSQACWILADPA